MVFKYFPSGKLYSVCRQLQLPQGHHSISFPCWIRKNSHCKCLSLHSNSRLRNTKLGKTVPLQHKAFKMEKYCRRNSGELWKGRLLSREFGGGTLSLHTAQPTMAISGRARVCNSAQAHCGRVHKAIISWIFERYGKEKEVWCCLCSHSDGHELGIT